MCMLDFTLQHYIRVHYVELSILFLFIYFFIILLFIYYFLARLDEVGVSKMFKFYVKVFYVMGKALSGKLSCPCDRSCFFFLFFCSGMILKREVQIGPMRKVRLNFIFT